MFVVWRNRVIFAGMRDQPFSVFATDVILPGLEQTSFNMGTMFPVNAKVPLPAAVTGLGVAGTTTDMDASAPLLFFTLTRTFICNGDPFSTVDQATMVEVSSRIGCIGHDSIVNTPLGTIFCGLDSVYLIPPGGGYPQDIGWPIADQIRAIIPGLRARIVACFHKQFYKLAIPSSGATSNTHQWWLDLRQGIGDIPSWWGPHTGPDVSAFATDPSATNEIDRGYSAKHASDVVLHHHVQRLYADFDVALNHAVPIVSRLRSGRFDADQPFIVKIFTRIRVIAQTGSKSDIHVSIVTDGGVTWPDVQPIHLGEDMDDPGQWVPRADFPDGHWAPPPTPINRSFGERDPTTHQVSTSRAKFGTISPVEAQTITPSPAARLSAIVTHHGPMPRTRSQTATNVELRDFELLFLLSERKVRYISYAIGGKPQRPERISK
jgi:hypothetical protein